MKVCWENNSSSKVENFKDSELTKSNENSDNTKDGKSFKRAFEDYTESATMHGLRYAFSGRYGMAKRVLWLLVILGMLTGFSVTFVKSVIQYYQYETFISTQIQPRPFMKFPSVTLCNVNVGQEDKIERVSTEYASYLRASSGLIGGLAVPRHPLPKMSQNISFGDFHELFGLELSDVFVSCGIGSRKVDCAKYIVKQGTDKGRCYTFNSYQHIRENGDIEIKSSGPSYGIALTIDVDPDNYGHPLRLGEGYAVLVHSPEVFPRMEGKSFYVEAGKEYYYSMQKSEITNLPAPYSDVDCIEEKDYEKFKMSHNIIGERPYSYESCMRSCYVKSTSNYCQCAVDFENSPEHECTMWNISKCLNAAAMQYYSSGEDCGCMSTCKKTKFHAELSSLSFPNKLMSDYAKQLKWPVQNVTQMKLRYLHLHIYYGSMDEIINEQVAVIEISQLLSNFGGQMGLYMGASIITMLEFFDFLFSMISGYCKKKK